MRTQAYRVRLLFTALALLACGLSGVSAYATPQSSRLSTIDQQLRELKKKKAAAAAQSRDLRNQVDRLDRELGEISGRLDSLRSDEQRTAAQRETTRKRLELVRAALARRTKELEVLQSRLELQREMLGERASSLYRNEQLDSLAILTTFLSRAHGLDDLLARFSLLSFVLKGDIRLVAELEDTEAQAVRKKATVEAERGRIEAMYMQLRIQEESIAALKRAEEAEKGRAAEKAAEKKTLLGGVEKDRRSYEAMEKELQAESNRIEAYLASLGSGGPSQLSGSMRWPAIGTVSSTYGWRTHPVYGDRRFHSGIDISASSGSSIFAAAAGTVIFTGYRGGYGNTTIIDHGGGITTLYAHQSSITAGSGSHVSAGQVIGRVGSTGLSTGPHLHFEVRVNGAPRNPMGYL